METDNRMFILEELDKLKYKKRIDWESIVMTPFALLWGLRWLIVILTLGIYLISKL